MGGNTCIDSLPEYAYQLPTGKLWGSRRRSLETVKKLNSTVYEDKSPSVV